MTHARTEVQIRKAIEATARSAYNTFDALYQHEGDDKALPRMLAKINEMAGLQKVLDKLEVESFTVRVYGILMAQKYEMIAAHSKSNDCKQ